MGDNIANNIVSTTPLISSDLCGLETLITRLNNMESQTFPLDINMGWVIDICKE